MRFDAGEILQLEEDLLAGRMPIPKQTALLLEALKHLRTCGAVPVSRKRRAPPTRGHRRRSRKEKRGHGRNGGDDYPGAERVECPHPGYKPGDACPNARCRGRLHRFTTTAGDVELTAGPLVTGKVYSREVLRCSWCQATFTAPLPSEAHGGKYHPSVDAVVSVARYEMGLPHHRLARWQEWAGIPLPASTQCERAAVMANAVLPILHCLEKKAAEQAVLSSDDTGARILSLAKENETKGAKERTGVFTTSIVARGLDAGTATIVLFKTGRNHQGENVDGLLAGRRSDAAVPIHMTDAASQMPRRARVPANCLTHARQYFVETYPAFPRQSERVIADIATVYDIEDDARSMDPVARLEHHRRHSGPVLRTLRAWIDEQLAQRLVEPNGRLGKAFRYVQNHWAGLTRFLVVPGVPLDNNSTERQLKTSVRHRKCSLFFRTQQSADIGDILMSVIRTCVVNGGDPVAYLTALGKHAVEARAAPEAWLPWTYKATLADLS